MSVRSPGRWVAPLADASDAELRAIMRDKRASRAKRTVARLWLDTDHKRPEVRRQAWRLLVERVEGKPHQSVTQTVEVKPPASMVIEAARRLRVELPELRTPMSLPELQTPPALPDPPIDTPRRELVEMPRAAVPDHAQERVIPEVTTPPPPPPIAPKPQRRGIKGSALKDLPCPNCQWPRMARPKPRRADGRLVFRGDATCPRCAHVLPVQHDGSPVAQSANPTDATTPPDAPQAPAA